jgi:hypothetical protein
MLHQTLNRERIAMKTDYPLQVLGCGACHVSRRSFLASCAACAAAWPSWATPARAAAEAKKLRIRVAFSHPTPDKITWPNVGYDYEGRSKELVRQLGKLCPDIEFHPVHILNADQAKQVMAQDSQANGYLLYVLGMGGGAAALAGAAGQAGRPMVVVEDHYGGPFSLGFNGRAAKAGWKAVCLATSRLQDVADAVNCFRVLQKPGATTEDFLAAAQATCKKNLAAPGDLTCRPDKVTVSDVGDCVKKLRASKILLVGRDAGPQAKTIADEFGIQVLSLKTTELHEAFAQAAPATAARWAERWISGAEKVIEPAREEIVKSGAMHVGMEQLLKRHNAQAISINCLGGFYNGQLQAFPCLGFVELNNSGLVGACEGDLPSTVTMLAMGYLVGRPGFISDPVIDTAKNQIIYAHCVAPTKVFGPQGEGNPYHIRSHSEDRKGAAVRSLLPLGYLTTTLKFLPGRREVIVHQGKAVANIDDDRACRTKLACEVTGDIERLFGQWSHGWHRVTYYGDLRQPLTDLCQALRIKVTEEA